MFTGIIETLGKIVEINKFEENIEFGVRSSFADQLKIDQSVAHDGVCLTVTRIEGDLHFVTAIYETLLRTNLNGWQVGSEVNLERCLRADSRFDGHIVQGHVDQTAVCRSVVERNGSWEFLFEYDENSGNMTVEKGSICINGVSLTVVNSTKNSFSVAIIPYTFAHTNFHDFKINTVVNLEFDIVGKYIRKLFDKYQLS